MIINSILDNDFYKFTMMLAVYEKYPTATASYAFVNRDLSFLFSELFFETLQNRIQELHSLQLSQDEYSWLQAINAFPTSFLDFLKNFRFNPQHVSCTFDNATKQIQLTITGPWVETILLEVPLLALITQTYFEVVEQDWDHDLQHYADKTLKKGIELSNAHCLFSDFGTRRRRSYDTQKAAIDALFSIDKEHSSYVGTSNVHFSLIHNTSPIGTMAHEWVMAHAGLFGIENAHKSSLKAWLEVHKGKFGIALTDTYTTDLFFKDFSPELAHAYTGLRQDSGSPFEFADKAFAFYKRLGINPKDKKIVFSDGLNVERAISIQKYTEKKLSPAYGIGTSLTNDFGGSLPLNIVIKMTSINGVDVAKITDDFSKASGSPDAIARTKALVEKIS